MKSGTVVMSLQGHDKDKLYLVVRCEGDYLFLCDGKTKLLKSPKKKKRKHVSITDKVVDLTIYNPLYDAHIRKALSGLLKEEVEGLG